MSVLVFPQFDNAIMGSSFTGEWMKVFRKSSFCLLKKGEGLTLHTGLSLFFLSLLLWRKQTAARTNTLVACGGDFIFRLGFLAYTVFSLKKLNSNQHFKSCTSDLEMEISGISWRMWVSGNTSPSFLWGRSSLNCSCHCPVGDHTSHQFLTAKLATFTDWGGKGGMRAGSSEVAAKL